MSIRTQEALFTCTHSGSTFPRWVGHISLEYPTAHSMLLVILRATFHWNNLSAAYLPGDSILLSSSYSGDRKRKWVPAAHPETPASEQALAWVSAFLRRGWRRVGGKVLEIFISLSATPLSPHIHSFRAKAAWPGKWSVIGKKKLSIHISSNLQSWAAGLRWAAWVTGGEKHQVIIHTWVKKASKRWKQG